MKEILKNTEQRPHIVPNNYICNECPYFERYSSWDSRGACCAPFEQADGFALAFYDGECTPICDRVSTRGFVARPCVDDNDRLHFRGDFAYVNDGNYYTSEYATENFYYCDNCGDYVRYASDYNFDLHMCTSCADEYIREQMRIIGNWHSHKGLYSVIGDARDPYTIGLEIEVEGYDCDHEATARRINEEFPSAFYFEWDCSLYDGYENITEPHTLDAFERLDLERLENIFRQEGYSETDDADTTGLHVHYATAFLGDSDSEKIRTFARLIRFYDHNFDILCDMTERKDIDHSVRNSDHYENNCYDYYDDYALVESQVDGSRYVAVNAQNFYGGTFEIRLCDGTIRADKIRAWVDFNIAVMDCLKEQNTVKMCDVVPYMSNRAIDFFRM